MKGKYINYAESEKERREEYSTGTETHTERERPTKHAVDYFATSAVNIPVQYGCT